MMGMLTAVALAFDRPFSGVTGINGEAWATMVTHFNIDLKDETTPYSDLPPPCLHENAD
jgi:hypothetical protein